MTPVSSLDASSAPFFSWLLLSWAWDDRPKPHRLSGQAACGLSCGQSFVGNARAYRSIDERVEPFQRVPFDVASVEPKDKLIDIPFQVFLARLVIDALESALEDCPHALNAVRTCHASNILVGRVIDALLLEEQPVQIVVGGVFISVERGADCDMPMNCRLNVGNTDALNRHGLQR